MRGCRLWGFERLFQVFACLTRPKFISVNKAVLVNESHRLPNVSWDKQDTHVAERASPPQSKRLRNNICHAASKSWL